MDYLEQLTKSLMDKDSPLEEELKSKDKIIKELKCKNILIVDDNDNSILILEIILKNLGHNIFMAKDGIEAFETFKSCHSKNILIDIIFMDIRMPKMNGIESSKLIRKYETDYNLTPCKIIIVTAFTNYDKDINEVDIDNVIYKPVNKSSILDNLNN